MQELLEWIRTTLPMDLETPRMIEQKIESMQVDHKEVKSIKKGMVGVKLNQTARSKDKVFVIEQTT